MTEELKTPEKVSLKDVITITYLTPDNTVFAEKEGFISLSVAEKDENGSEKKTDYERVFLHRTFPFEMPEEYISVLNKDKEEIGIIKKLTDFPIQTQEIFRRELQRKYFAFNIEKIVSVKERFGFGYVKAVANGEDVEFTVSDPYRSIVRISSDRIYIVDVDGNRYEIKSLSALDAKSAKKIELYL